MSKFLFILIFFISGCGLQRLAVSQLDQLIEIQTASRLDLYSKQKEALEKDINHFLKGEQSQSTQILTLLEKIDPGQTQEFDQWWSLLTKEYLRIAHEYSKILAKYLALQDAKQKEHFISKLNEENQKLKEKTEHLRIDQIEERVEFFFGEINPEQKTVMKNYFPEWKARSHERLKRRLALQAELSKPQTEPSYLLLFQNYQIESLKNSETLVQFLKKICQSLTPKQKKHFSEKKDQGIDLIKTFQKTKY